MSKSNNSRRSNQKERMRRVGEDKTHLTNTNTCCMMKMYMIVMSFTSH